MTRLNNDIRDSIVRRAADTAFRKEYEVLVKEEHSLGMELYQHVFDKATLAAVKKIDKKWFRQDASLRFNCGGYDLRFKIKEAVSVPGNGGYCSNLGNVTGDLATRAQAFSQKKEDTNKRKHKAEHALSAVLYSVSTVNKLKTVWPEGKEFYSIYDEQSSKSKGGLPAVQIQELNEMFGLKAAA